MTRTLAATIIVIVAAGGLYRTLADTLNLLLSPLGVCL